MVSTDTKKLYKYYLKRLNRYHIQFPCLVCEEKKKPSEFKHHFEVFHLPFKNTCCWCLQYSWKPKEKTQHAQHLFDCFTRFLLNFTASSKERLRIVELNMFHSTLAKMSDCPMLCPWQNFSCLTLVKPGEMEKHFRTEHVPFDPTLSCVWCEGAVFWPRGQKSLSIDHILSCFETYCIREKEIRPLKEEGEENDKQGDTMVDVMNSALEKNDREWNDVLAKSNAQWKIFLTKNNAEWKEFLERNNAQWREIVAKKDADCEAKIKELKKDYEWLKYKYPLNN